MTTRRGLMAVVLGALLGPVLATVTAAPAAASWTTAAPATLVSFGCKSTVRSVDAALDSAGTLHTFATRLGGTCSGSRIRYAKRTGSTSTALSSPYTGTVLAVAADSTGAWVLFRHRTGTRLGHRTATGWDASQLLSPQGARSGDLVARDGLWWAVWSEVTTGTRASIFEARTIGGTVGRTQVTFLAATDTAPALAVRASGPAFLAFARRAESTGQHEVLIFNRATPTDPWSPLFTTTDGDNHEPDVIALNDTSVYAGWRHGTRIVTATNGTGSFVTRTHPNAGARPRLVTSRGRVFLAFTRSTSPLHVMLSERAGDLWIQRDITPDVGLDRRAAAVVARSGDARVVVDSPYNVHVINQRRPSVAAFNGLGTWVDRLDYSLNPENTVLEMRARGVKTLYLQTGKFDQPTDVIFADRVGRWIEAAHAAGIKVVGWYFPGYGSKLSRDVRRTAAIKSFRSPRGQAFDALGIDIERRGADTPSTFNADVTTHLQRVRERIGGSYPISAIVPSPVGMELAPVTWAGFPWRSIGRYADVVQPMGYWTFRTTCGSNPDHCPYGYSRGSVERARRFTGLPAHEIGGIHGEPSGRVITNQDVDDFVQGTLDAGAIGGSLYDYRTTLPTFWSHLAPLN
jgi:hypothetical protein